MSSARRGEARRGVWEMRDYRGGCIVLASGVLGLSFAWHATVGYRLAADSEQGGKQNHQSEAISIG